MTDTNPHNPQDDDTTSNNSSDDAKSYENSLQAEIDRLERDKRALQSEFNDIATGDSDKTTPEAIKAALIAAAPTALQKIIQLASFAESESVQANCAKYITDVGMGLKNAPKGSGEEADNEIKKLLKELSGD